jgi:general stress protein YciG
METPKEYYYTYYSYEEYGRGYIGSRGCKCLPEEDVKYFGSFTDKTFRPTHKIVLNSNYSTREEAYADEIILQQYYKVVENPHFVNRAYQTSSMFYVSREQAFQNGKKSWELGVGIHSLKKDELCKLGKQVGNKYGKIIGKQNKELGRGIFAMTPEDKSELGRRNGKKNYENGVGIAAMPKEDKISSSIKGGNRCKEFGLGLFSISPEEKREIGRKSGKKCKELGLGIFSLTKDEKVEIGRKCGLKHKENKTGVCGISPEEHSKRMSQTNLQKWRCLETGHISNAGGLSRYQKRLGIDTSLRERLE